MSSPKKGSRPTNAGERGTMLNGVKPSLNASRPVTANALKSTVVTPKSATMSRPLVTRDSIARRAPITSSTRQARLAMQEQRRRTQNMITAGFLAILVAVAAIIVWNVIPKPSPVASKPTTYSLLSDFTKGGKATIKSQVAPVTLADGLQYADVKVGTGQAVKATDTITVNYTGWLTDGTKFDSSLDRGQAAQFPLSGVIKGWTEGLVGLKIGGERRLYVPAALGYGATGQPPTIPANAPLIFDVSLVSIP